MCKMSRSNTMSYMGWENLYIFVHFTHSFDFINSFLHIPTKKSSIKSKYLEYCLRLVVRLDLCIPEKDCYWL